MERQHVNDTINTLVSHYFKRKRHECGLTGKQMGEHKHACGVSIAAVPLYS